MNPTPITADVERVLLSCYDKLLYSCARASRDRNDSQTMADMFQSVQEECFANLQQLAKLLGRDALVDLTAYQLPEGE